MGSRQRQRILRQLESEAAEKNIDGSQSEVEEEVESPQPKTRNAFAYFSSDSEDSSSSSEEDETEEESKGLDAKVTTQKNEPSEQSGSSAPSSTEEIDEDTLLEEAVKLAEQEKAAGQRDEFDDCEGNNGEIRSAELFKLDRRGLNPASELKRQFGQALASQGQQDVARELERGAQTSNPRSRRGRQRGRQNGGRIQQARSTLLAQPDDNWVPPPSYNAGDGARMLQLEDGRYTYDASEGYQAAQEEFRRARESADPNMLVEVLNKHPFHVDTLLQLSEVYFATSNFETGELMLRRALVALESWMHPSFRSGITDGSCQLVIEEFEDASRAGLNLALVRAVFKSMQMSSRRGCHETALSLAKLVLKFEPALDPKRVLLCIDYYALNANQPSFLWNLLTDESASFEFLECSCSSGKELGKFLPNMAYALAMAQRMRGVHSAEVFIGEGHRLGSSHTSEHETECGASQSRDRPEKRDSTSENNERSVERDLVTPESDPHPDKLLRCAILQFPGGVLALARQLESKLHLDQPPWRELVLWCESAEPLVETVELSPADRWKLYQLYAIRSKSLWDVGAKSGDSGSAKESGLDWLTRVTQGVVADYPDAATTMEDVRKVLGQRGTPSCVQEHLSHAPLVDFTDDIQSLPAMEEMIEQSRAPSQPNVNMDQNALMLFLQTLMPWARVPQRQPDQSS